MKKKNLIKKNLIKHYFALITMLFVVSGSFVSNLMAADIDYQVICSGNSVKLVAVSGQNDDDSLSKAFTHCTFCHLGEDQDLNISNPPSSDLTNHAVTKNYLLASLISKKNPQYFFAQAPPLFS